MAATRIFALFNLKPGQDPMVYEAWARDRYPCGQGYGVGR